MTTSIVYKIYIHVNNDIDAFLFNYFEEAYVTENALTFNFLHLPVCVCGTINFLSCFLVIFELLAPVSDSVRIL